MDELDADKRSTLHYIATALSKYTFNRINSQAKRDLSFSQIFGVIRDERAVYAAVKRILCSVNRREATIAVR